MEGLDCLGADEEIGSFDYLSVLKTVGSVAGGLAGGGAGGASGGKADPAAAAEKQKLQDEKAAAEHSASTWKMVGIIVAVLVGAVGISVIAKKSSAPAAAPAVTP